MKRFLSFFLVSMLLYMHLGAMCSYLQTCQSIKIPDFCVKDNQNTQSNIPEFSLEDIDITGGPGIYNLTATIQHSGIVPSTGLVPISWENKTFSLELEDGSGTLNESIIDVDLDGDGDKNDTFDVKWDGNATRRFDATVNGVHIYSIFDSFIDDITPVLTYSIAEKSKFFTLGNRKHALYISTEDWADFGFNTKVKMFPSPCLDLWIHLYNLSTYDDFSLRNFQINGEGVQLNNSIVIFGTFWPGGSFDALVSNIFPKTPMKVSSGEKIEISCTIEVYKNITAEIVVVVNWSPDGVVRYRYDFWRADRYISGAKLVASPTISSSTTVPEPPPRRIAGFSFTFCLFAIIIPIAFLRTNEGKRRYD